MTYLPNNLMTAFIELCDPWRDSISSVPSDEQWNSISELSKLHGVTPFLFYRAKSLGIKLPEKIEKEWLGYYLYQIAEEKKAVRQIKELKNILDPEGIPFILLKGASAVLRLYPQAGLRTFCDLDILIPVNKVGRFKQVMTIAGYKASATRNSPEDEELQKFDKHLDPLLKEEKLMIEPHLSILKGRSEYSIALPKIWWDKEETKYNGIFVSHLSKEHFIIHTLLHCARDLSTKGFIEIKGLIDVVLTLKIRGLDWSKVRDIWRKWGLEKDILPIVATLNRYWKVDIPLKEKTESIDLETLVLGVEDQKKYYYAKIPAGYIKRLYQTRELPSILSKLRYLLHLFFPTRENLRSRYAPAGKSILPYYFFHLLVQCRKFFMGLWYQSL
jgi:hypothetical protein